MDLEIIKYQNIKDVDFTLPCLHSSTVDSIPDVIMHGCERCGELPTIEDCPRICSLITLIIRERFPKDYLAPVPLYGDRHLYSAYLRATLDYISPDQQLKKKIVLMLIIATMISKFSEPDGKLTKGVR